MTYQRVWYSLFAIAKRVLWGGEDGPVGKGLLLTVSLYENSALDLYNFIARYIRH